MRHPIAVARFHLDLSQWDLAVALGLKQGTISEWERGYREPTESQWLAIAAVLGVPVQELKPAGELMLNHQPSEFPS